MLYAAHQNYYGKTVEKNMFILSVVKSEEFYRAILWAKTVSKPLLYILVLKL